MEELQEGVEYPPELRDCMFEVTQRRQYSAKTSLIKELARNNIPETILQERSG